MTGPEENIFCKMLGYSTFARFRDMRLLSYLLNVQESMTAGLSHMASETFYEGMIRDWGRTHSKDLHFTPFNDISILNSLRNLRRLHLIIPATSFGVYDINDTLLEISMLAFMKDHLFSNVLLIYIFHRTF